MDMLNKFAKTKFCYCMRVCVCVYLFYLGCGHISRGPQFIQLN